jgi:hypothetical protein
MSGGLTTASGIHVGIIVGPLQALLMTYLPRWLAMEAFTMLIREASTDFEAQLPERRCSGIHLIPAGWLDKLAIANSSPEWRISCRRSLRNYEQQHSNQGFSHPPLKTK